MTLTFIVVASIIGGALSLLAAALCAFAVLSAWVPRMISYAVGVLLATAFLGLLPEALASGAAPERVLATTLIGICAFFALEKLAVWRHGHNDAASVPQPIGATITIGDGFHNFVDGVLIAAAFLTGTALGVVTAIAVVIHEIPQEVGDFLVLRHAGYSKRRALFLNLLASSTSIAGGVLGYFALGTLQSAVPYALALAAASFIYIAIADLIPHLHATDGKAVVWQVALLCAGIATVAATDSIARVFV